MTEDEDLKRIEDKLVEALPGLAGEEKPPEYADAPQWQKDAWDSETNKALREMAEKLNVPQEVVDEAEPGLNHWSYALPTDQTGGWCAPSACGAGICTMNDVHEHDCPGAGWGYNSGPFNELLELPAISVRRGGIRWPRFSVETLVVSRKRFLRRTRWELHIRYREGDGRPMHHYMEFTSESAAHNAEQIVKFMMSWINDSYHEEKEQRR